MTYIFQQIGRLSVAGILLFASIGFAQDTMELTGAGDSTLAYDNTLNAYELVGPYTGSVWNGSYSSPAPAPSTPPIYSGYVICDDLTDNANLDEPWNATATNAADVAGSDVLFTAGYTDPNGGTGWSAGQYFTEQQVYNAIAWLANQLVLPANATNPTAQTNYQFAIWDITGGATTDPDGGATALIQQAFDEVVDDNYVGSNVTVYTPAPAGAPGMNPSQEFLVVPEAPTPALLAVDVLGLLSLIAFLRRSKSRFAR